MKPMMTMLLTASAMVAAPAQAQDKNWNFGNGTSPERWSEISTQYAACDAGMMQSPIDLGGANVAADVALDVNFGTAAGKMSIAEEKVQVDFDAGQGFGMMSHELGLNLVQVHFHTPAEHAFDGSRYPLVAHFVHASDDGKLGVLGVMFAEGAANGELQKIVDGVGRGSGSAVRLDLTDLVPDDLKVYRYMGSLTTPPCSEGVNWHVADKPLTASAAQIRAMEAALGSSARSIQPLNGRLVIEPVR